MKIKKINRKPPERPIGTWINGRFVETKIKQPGRLSQLNKSMHKKTDSEAVALWKRIDNGN